VNTANLLCACHLLNIDVCRVSALKFPRLDGSENQQKAPNSNIKTKKLKSEKIPQEASVFKQFFFTGISGLFRPRRGFVVITV
jgi:hypothetical protein